jgi:DNA-binding CsgD family transcriptional regulator
MKKRFWGALPLLLLIPYLTGCNSIGEKAASLSNIYGASAVLSGLLLVGCCLVLRKKRQWFILLFSSVLIVNIGYTFLSLSTCLEAALWANRVSYLGSVFLPFAMLMIILHVTNTQCKKWVSVALFVLAVIMFLIAASPGILPIYYKEVSFRIVDGAGVLVKVYGPLHPLYLFYLVGYFGAMIAVILRASVKNTIDSTAHAIIIAIAVFVNIGVWLIEQLTSIDFEFLSISYIISELFLLGVHLVMNEMQRLRELVRQKEEALQATAGKKPQKAVHLSQDTIESFIHGLETLTPTERIIYNAYLDGKSSKEVMSELSIKENTLKFHNKNLYGKLGITSRKQLLSIAAQLKKDSTSTNQ